ncbi:Membrane-associating domain [Geosmithia morbida]|uniref:Membrane-associating domain n=1 Tax=Geosmithia morbida TaxID=1094350 RepID=A0A9P4YZH1_9HYPO|nr:Membrane-associating domain [Geosmithia morbida]KAF4125775.1 Membrane-associating domain [Geosmithia morbida]
MERIASIILRIAEIGFGAVVAGVNGDIIDAWTDAGADSWSMGRFIYTEVVAGLSILLSILRLIPLSWTFTHWHADLIISLCWWAAFGLLVDQLDQGACGGAFDWDNISLRGDPCGKFKAVVAFTFLSALVWLVSAIIGFFWTEKRVARSEMAGLRRRRWHRWSYA